MRADKTRTPGHNYPHRFPPKPEYATTPLIYCRQNLPIWTIPGEFRRIVPGATASRSDGIPGGFGVIAPPSRGSPAEPAVGELLDLPPGPLLGAGEGEAGS